MLRDLLKFSIIKQVLINGFLEGGTNNNKEAQMRYRISKYKHLHSNRFRYLSSSIPLVCASGLLVVFGMMVSPVGSIGEEAHAVTVSGGAVDSGSVSLSLVNPEVTNLQTSATSGTVAYITKDFTVTSSNEYNIYVQTSTGNSNLTNGASSIPSLTGSNIAPSSFSDNTWGYTVADNSPNPSTLTYSSVPTNSTNAIKTGSNASNKAFRLAFAAKFGDNATSGHYRTNIVLSVAANPGEVTSGFGDINYMQEMNTDVCKAARVGDTGQLIDSRDNKVYWVAKLADLNCWMTQNLDYNDSSSTKVSTPSGWTDTSTGYRAYYDPGNYVLTTPANWTNCGNQFGGMSGCTSKGWTNVDGWYANSSPTASSITDSTNKLYDAHYHVGNYYSFQSATNGTGSSVTGGGVAQSSICPGQWRLPTGSDSNNGSFGYLLGQYSVQSTPTGNSNTIYGHPLYFAAGGNVASGNLYNAGSNGYYWSRSVKAWDGDVYYLYFNSSYVSPSSNGNRYVGQSVRCLVMGS